RQFDIVNVRAQRNRTKRQRISQIWSDILPGGDCRSNTQSIGGENVTQLPVGIFNQRNSGGAVRVVLNPDYLRGSGAFAPFEIDLAILLFVAAADMARRESSKVIAAAGFLFRCDETLCRPPLRDFVETRQRFEPKRRCKRAKIFQGHNKSLFTPDRSSRPLPASRS